MKKFVTLLVTLLVIASLSFCAVAEEKPFAGQTLTISTFSFNAELLQKNIYDPFEEATGATLVVDTGRNPERVTKIIESPDDYDVVVIGDMFVDQLRKAGVLDTFDSSKLSNIEGFRRLIIDVGQDRHRNAERLVQLRALALDAKRLIQRPANAQRHQHGDKQGGQNAFPPLGQSDQQPRARGQSHRHAVVPQNGAQAERRAKRETARGGKAFPL